MLQDLSPRCARVIPAPGCGVRIPSCHRCLGGLSWVWGDPEDEERRESSTQPVAPSICAPNPGDPSPPLWRGHRVPRDGDHLHGQDAEERTAHTFYCISQCESPELLPAAAGVTLGRWCHAGGVLGGKRASSPPRGRVAIAEMPQIPFFRLGQGRGRGPGARQSIGEETRKVLGFPRGPAGRCRALPHTLGQPVPRASEPEPREATGRLSQGHAMTQRCWGKNHSPRLSRRERPRILARAGGCSWSDTGGAPGVPETSLLSVRTSAVEI